MEEMLGEIPHSGEVMGLMLNFASDLLLKRASVATRTLGSGGRDILVADLEDTIAPRRGTFKEKGRPSGRLPPKPRSTSRADAAGRGSSGSAGITLLGVFTGGSLAADADLGGRPRSAQNFGETTDANLGWVGSAGREAAWLTGLDFEVLAEVGLVGLQAVGVTAPASRTCGELAGASTFKHSI